MGSKLVDSRHEDGITWITINLPEKLNALSFDVIRQLEELFEAAAGDERTRVVVITGAGDKAFVAGADINEILNMDMSQAPEVVRRGQELMNTIENLGKPVIAAINGYALGGGCELALACTIRVASSNAMLGLPEIKLGLLPGYGGTQRLARVIGRGRALAMMLSGDPVPASQALDWGLVTQVVEPDALQEAVAKLAGRLANAAPLSVRSICDAVYRGADLGLAEGLAIEAAHFVDLCASEDMREGTSAFLEKRKPDFRGK